LNRKINFIITKTMKNAYLSLALMLLLTSCVSIIKFPVSSVIPTAEITAQVKQDKKNNYVINITANYLASAQRLSPPKTTYVVWMVTKENSTANIGQFNGENAKKATLNTLTPFQPVELFITAENEGDLTSPNGPEISRVIIRNNR